MMSGAHSSVERKQLIDLWSKYEDVAMHFNDLVMRLRTQALGAVASIVAIAGFLVESMSSDYGGQPPWRTIFVGSFSLFAAWVLVFVLDTFYYSKLLLGAVDALLELEDESDGLIILSTRIDERFPRRSFLGCRRGEHRAARSWVVIVFFYAPVGLALAYLTWFCWFHVHTGIRI